MTNTRVEIFMDKEEGKKCLLEVHKTLDQVGVNHFLILGTALGAYRDQGFTPTEKDIDIGFLYENFSLVVKEIAASLSQEDYEVRLVAKPFHRCRAIIARKNGVKVDLVSYILWKGLRFCPNSDPKTKRYSIVHNPKMLECYEEIEVFGNTFLVPSPIERYLLLEYGEDWKTPKQDHRSRTRHYEFRRENSIPDDYLDS